MYGQSRRPARGVGPLVSLIALVLIAAIVGSRIAAAATRLFVAPQAAPHAAPLVATRAACGSASHPTADQQTPDSVDYFVGAEVVLPGATTTVDTDIYTKRGESRPPNISGLAILDPTYNPVAGGSASFPSTSSCDVAGALSHVWNYVGSWTAPATPGAYELAMTFTFPDHTTVIYFAHLYVYTSVPAPATAHWDARMTPNCAGALQCNLFQGPATLTGVGTFNTIGNPAGDGPAIDRVRPSLDDGTNHANQQIQIPGDGTVGVPLLAAGQASATAAFPFVQHTPAGDIARVGHVTVAADTGPDNKIGTTQYDHTITVSLPIGIRQGNTALLTAGHWVLDVGYTGYVDDKGTRHPAANLGLGHSFTFYGNPGTPTGTPLGNGTATLAGYPVNASTIDMPGGVVVFYIIDVTAHDPALRTACPARELLADTNTIDTTSVSLCPGTRYDTTVQADYALSGGGYGAYPTDILSDVVAGSTLTGGTPPATATPTATQTPVPTDTPLPTWTPAAVATPCARPPSLPTPTPVGRGSGPSAPVPTIPPTCGAAGTPVPARPATGALVLNATPAAYAWANVLAGDAALVAPSTSHSAVSAVPDGPRISWQVGRLLRLLPAVGEHPEEMPLTLTEGRTRSMAVMYPIVAHSTSYRITAIGAGSTYCGSTGTTPYTLPDEAAYPNEVNPSGAGEDTTIVWAAPDAPGPWDPGVIRCEIAPLVAPGASGVVTLTYSVRQTAIYSADFPAVSPATRQPPAVCPLTAAMAGTGSAPPPARAPGMIPATGVCDGGGVGWSSVKAELAAGHINVVGGRLIAVTLSPARVRGGRVPETITVVLERDARLSIVPLFKREVG